MAKEVGQINEDEKMTENMLDDVTLKKDDLSCPKCGEHIRVHLYRQGKKFGIQAVIEDKRAEKMNHEMTAYDKSLVDFDIKDEVLKLKLIVEESKEAIYPSYFLEKLNRILNGVPIALCITLQQKFNEMKSEG